MAQAQRDGCRLGLWVGRFKQGHALHGGADIAQAWCLGQPLVGDGGRAQRQRHQRVAPIHGAGGGGPIGDGMGIKPQTVGEFGKPVLRMILAIQTGMAVLQQPRPDIARHGAVKPGQDHRPLRQARHRRHQLRGRPARAGRACDDDRIARRIVTPARGKGGHDPGLTRGLGQRRLVGHEIGHDLEETLRALPMLGMFGHVETGDIGWADTFFEHLAHQIGKAIGQIVKRRARGEIGIVIEQRADQADQLQPEPQRRDGRRDARDIGIFAQRQNRADAGQETRAALCVKRAQAPLHPGIGDVEMDARDRLGRVVCQQGLKPVDQRGAEIDTQGGGEQAGAGAGWKEPKHGPTSPRPVRSPRGGRHRPNGRDR